MCANVEHVDSIVLTRSHINSGFPDSFPSLYFWITLDELLLHCGLYYCVRSFSSMSRSDGTGYPGIQPMWGPPILLARRGPRGPQEISAISALQLIPSKAHTCLNRSWEIWITRKLSTHTIIIRGVSGLWPPSGTLLLIALHCNQYNSHIASNICILRACNCTDTFRRRSQFSLHAHIVQALDNTA